MKLLLRLYPAAWRKRYADELEELMSDAPAGWRTSFDVFKGAMTMRLKKESPVWLALGLMAAGAVAGGAGSYLIPKTWLAGGVVEVRGSGGSRAIIDSIEQSQSMVTSRRSLLNLITDSSLDIYRDERRTQPLEDIEDTMRHDTRISISPRITEKGGVVFMVRFVYSDPAKARDMASAMIARLSQALRGIDPHYTVEVLDAPAMPKKPNSPVPEKLAVLGALAGLMIALITSVARRRPTSSGPGLQPA